jgi:putative flippase GtrA
MIVPGKIPIVRWLKFNVVGAMGIVVQLLALTLLLRILGLHYLWATVLAVETAVLHNFVWHWKWTWSDRRSAGLNHVAATLLRFNFSNGLISLFGTVLCTGILTGVFRLNPILANVLSLGPCCVINFLVSDRFIFMSLNAGESA